MQIRPSRQGTPIAPITGNRRTGGDHAHLGQVERGIPIEGVVPDECGGTKQPKPLGPGWTPEFEPGGYVNPNLWTDETLELVATPIEGAIRDYTYIPIDNAGPA